MRQIVFATLLCVLAFQKTTAQPGFCGAGNSTFSSANVFFLNDLNPTLDGQILPFGSHIIAAFDDNGTSKCAGFVQWNGNTVSMVVNGSDGNLPGYAANEAYKFIVQLADGCFVDSIEVAFEVSGIFTNPGVFQDGGLSKLASFKAFRRPWLSLDPTDGLCADSTAALAALASPLGGPHRFVWSNGDTSAVISGLPGGQYSVTATNAFGCSATASATAHNIPAMSLVLATEYDFATVACRSAASVTGGGTAPFAFSWSNGQTGISATGLPDGNFSVTATDANGCAAVETGHCTVSNASERLKLTWFSVFPNPGGEGFARLSAVLTESTEVSVRLLDALGSERFSTTASGAEISVSLPLNGLSPGHYVVLLRIADGQGAAVRLVVQ